MLKDLNCSYQVPFEIRVYHEAQYFALGFGIKWCRVRGNNVSSLRCPGYSLGLREDIAIRFKRWLNYVQN